MGGRLLEVEMGDPFSNHALEEAIFRLVENPTLRVWESQKSVVIGRAQLAEFETDLEYCRRNSVPVVRRFTAGGAVYNGPGNLNWSFFVPREAGPGMDPSGVFAWAAGRAVDALRRCGVPCDFRAPNSIFDGRGKISGMAAYVSRERFLCHGTLLIGADLAEVERLTKPSGSKIGGRYPRSRFAVVSNCGVRRDEFVRELATGSELKFNAGRLSEGEKELALELEPRYRSREWNLGDPFELDYR